MSKLFERLVKKRGLTPDFLSPKYESLKDPFLLPDMKKAVARIKKAIETNEKILIYGDYDVDGVTASTAIADSLKLAGIKAEDIEIPQDFVKNEDTTYNSIDDILVEEPGLWTVGFLDYTVHGTAVCNNNTGMHAKASNSEQTEAGGTECWCKMTNPKQSRWVFLNSYIDASSCIGDGGCAGGCANRVADDADFRGAVFGSVK